MKLNYDFFCGEGKGKVETNHTDNGPRSPRVELHVP